MGRNNNNRNRKQNNGGGGIPENVKEFASITFKKYKKQSGWAFDSKKEMKKDYYAMLVYDLSSVIDWILRNGHIQKPEIQEVKNNCLEKFVQEDFGPGFIKYLTKEVEEYDDEIENIEHLPIILADIIKDINEYNNRMKEENPNAEIEGPDDIYKLCKAILKKRLKKLKKKGIPEDMAFDLLTILPDKSSVKYAPFIRTRMIFDVIYYYAGKESGIDFGTIVSSLYSENDYRFVIGYALQERKEKYKNFNPGQQEVFNQINEFIFNALEEMPKNDIKDILINYIKVRQRDDANGKDSNRRYYISSLPSTMYPKICKVVDELKADNASNEKFL